MENAETTLNDYKDFLKNEKYKEWNDQKEGKKKAKKNKNHGEKFKFRPYRVTEIFFNWPKNLENIDIDTQNGWKVNL